jgi:predicted transcriptional regulator
VYLDVHGAGVIALFRKSPSRKPRFVYELIRDKRPGSIYELAKLIERDFKNVQGDLKLLERYGLVRLARHLALLVRRLP